MKQNSIKGRLVEYVSFTYFNWLIVVPLLVPWVVFRLQLEPAQFNLWLMDSFFVSLFLGWWTVKLDNRFAPWFYKRMGWKKKETHICAKCKETTDE